MSYRSQSVVAAAGLCLAAFLSVTPMVGSHMDAGLGAADGSAPAADGAADGSTAGAAASGGAELAPSVLQEPAPEVPCDPEVSRMVEPLVVGIDGTVNVSVDFDYQCSETNQRFDFFLVVENSSYLEPEGWGGRRLAGNLRDGLHDFVLKMDYDIGTRGGLIQYSNNETVNSELKGESGGQQQLISAIRNIAPTSSRTARANGEAVKKATELLTAAAAATDTQRLIMLVDAGAPMTNAPVDVFEACQAAKNEGILMLVYALREAGDRLTACADPEYFRGSSRDSGEDIPEDMQRLGESLAKGKQVERMTLQDSLSPQFEYVAGSGRPEEPARFLRELSWEVLPPKPPGGYSYRYDVAVAEGYAGEIEPLSESAALTLYYMDGTFAEVPLDNPRVCIYPPGHEDFCDSFIATLTPPAPTATVTSSPTPTVAEPDITPTPGATETPDVARVEVYLPINLDSVQLRVP